MVSFVGNNNSETIHIQRGGSTQDLDYGRLCGPPGAIVGDWPQQMCYIGGFCNNKIRVTTLGSCCGPGSPLCPLYTLCRLCNMPPSRCCHSSVTFKETEVLDHGYEVTKWSEPDLNIDHSDNKAHTWFTPEGHPHDSGGQRPLEGDSTPPSRALSRCISW